MSLPSSCEVLVIGGGIYGAWIACDAAERGLRTVLVERDDWGSGTSSASSKLIHGGLRYLEYGDVGLVAKALRERARLLRLAPHAVRPLRFLLPHGSDFRVNRFALMGGLFAYDLLAGARPGIPPHRAFASEDLLRRAPFLRGSDLRGGWSYGDATEDDARFVLELVDGAATAGASVHSQCPAIRLLRANGRVCGALVRDTVANADAEIRAEVVVDAAGAWAGALCEPTGLPARHTKGVHLTLPPLPIDEAFLLQGGDRRVFFLIPFYGATLVGTTDTDHRRADEAATITDADVDYLLAGVNARCPGLGWTRADVRAGFAGIRTLRGAPGAPSSISREWELWEPEPCHLLPLGGKYTSARVEAARTVDRCVEILGRDLPGTTATQGTPWAPSGAFAPWLAAQIRAGTDLGLDDTVAATLPRRHGTRSDALFTLVRSDPTLAERLHPQAPFCRAEVVHAARHERVHHLVDVLRRRVPLMILTRFDATVVADAANLVASELGWDAQRHQREVESVRRLWWAPASS